MGGFYFNCWCVKRRLCGWLGIGWVGRRMLLCLRLCGIFGRFMGVKILLVEWLCLGKIIWRCRCMFMEVSC